MLERGRSSMQTKVFSMTRGMRSGQSPCLSHDMLACSLDFAAAAAASENYCNSGAIQQHLSPAALHTTPVALLIILQNNRHAACISCFFLQRKKSCV